MAKRPVCLFTFVGHPTTAPETPEDDKRIKLSQKLTRLIGDNYLTPGANGYTEQELADAPARYAHLQSQKPVVPEAELQMQALALLQAGVKTSEIAEELDIPFARFAEWRQSPAFLTEWEAAKAEGSGRQVRSNVRRDAATAQRVPAEPVSFQPQPIMPVKSTVSVDQMQQAVLDKLRSGLRPGQLYSGEVSGFSQMKLAAWRKDPTFAAKWDEAKADGRIAKPAATQRTPAKKATPIMRIAAEPAKVITRPAAELAPRALWRERVEQERFAALRHAMLRCIDNGDPLPSDWIEEYNELTGRLSLAA